METVEQLTLFPLDSPVSHSATPDNGGALTMSVISGRRLCESLQMSGPLGLLAKMLLDSSVWQSQLGELQWKAELLPEKRTKTFTRRYIHNKRLCLSDVSVRTLKTSVTKSKFMCFRLHLSGPRTKETGRSLWATPSAADSVGNHGGGQSKSLRTDIYNTTKDYWATPQARDFRSGDDPTGPRAQRKQEQGWTRNLNDQVKLWPTPKSTLRGDCPSERERRTPDLHAAVKMWPTPRANDAEKRGEINAEDPRNGLPGAVRMWPTPAAQDSKNSTLPESQKERDSVPGALMREGHTGQLNPEWVETLMNFPMGWTDVE
ncbi:unknown protein [Paenibacillus amylolyticus]|uniref:Uncharacterized protein n=1 Tax=Paenibacillus amylolyticus TaxID=1451 RepID=A0A124DXX3_PAEAM|nr:unknown protein [Paenibacillus amylolyticus]